MDILSGSAIEDEALRGKHRTLENQLQKPDDRRTEDRIPYRRGVPVEVKRLCRIISELRVPGDMIGRKGVTFEAKRGHSAAISQIHILFGAVDQFRRHGLRQNHEALLNECR
jgi:hypothetical protein